MKSRKCDTEKYRRRRKKEAANHQDRERRQRELDHQRHLRVEEYRKRTQRLKEMARDDRAVDQRLVNVLALRLCQLSPAYHQELKHRHLKEVMKAVWSMWR
jgi:hypothetical protein